MPNDKGVPFEIVLGTDGKVPGLPFEFKSAQIQIVQDEPAKKPATGRERPGAPAQIVIVKEEPAKAASSLKMSTDGKTAAVVSADGTVVVYDVATGRELMRFPGKK